MMEQELAPNYPISNLTVIELETLITRIVQKVIREENSQKKAPEEVMQLETNHSKEEKKLRPYGQWRGQVQMSDDFDVLPESIAAAFAGEME